jgi:hypothetical protein
MAPMIKSSAHLASGDMLQRREGHEQLGCYPASHYYTNVSRPLELSKDCRGHLLTTKYR